MNCCPICNQLVKFGLEEHVNHCLDKAESGSSPNLSNNEASVPVKTRSFNSISSFCSKMNVNTGFKMKDNVINKCSKIGKKMISIADVPVPNFKTLLDLPYAIDAFKWGPLADCQGYFLTHFHSDHYDGLSSHWNASAPIFCSNTTAKLVHLRLKIEMSKLVCLPTNQWIEIDFRLGVFLIDANHCPGSVMFLFKVIQNSGNTKLVLHTGDFRAGPQLLSNPYLQRELSGQTLDILYLDTTYCAPEHAFPCQLEVISQCTEFIRIVVEDKVQQRFSPIKRLVMVGSYLIGKERIALALAKALSSLIYVPEYKRLIFNTFEWEEFTSILTDNPKEALVHIVPMGILNKNDISDYLEPYLPNHFTHVTAIRPTGWTGLKSTTVMHDYKGKDQNGNVRIRKQAISIHSIPYSEHSSFNELAAFLQQYPVKTVIPTVSNDYKDLYIDVGNLSPIEVLLTWCNYTKDSKG